MSHNSTPGATEGSIIGIVLGAGKSSRFGSPKQLLPFGDTTLLGQSVRNANASALDKVIAVLGRAAVVENSSYGTGCASSLLAGMDAAGECEAIMLILGDMPGVKAEFVDLAITEGRRERPWAAVCSYTGERRASQKEKVEISTREPLEAFPHSPERPEGATRLGHPFIFGREGFGDLRSLHGDKAVWKLIERFPERAEEISIPPELPPDVDAPEDYEAALSFFERDGA